MKVNRPYAHRMSALQTRKHCRKQYQTGFRRLLVTNLMAAVSMSGTCRTGSTDRQSSVPSIQAGFSAASISRLAHLKASSVTQNCISQFTEHTMPQVRVT